VRLELGADIPSCLIDPALFDAAVLNLVVNGRDAMLNGGEIRVVTERFVPTASDEMDTYVRVRVEDNGCGMPAEVLQKVFDPFLTTKGDRETGIGLAQVRTFVQMVGGQVHIASREGFGTTVELRFPAIHPDA
jgi:signal transduction histidine kinase